MFNKIKHYYNSKFWGKAAVADAVKCGYITEAEYEDITGETYVADDTREISAAEFVDILIGGDE